MDGTKTMPKFPGFKVPPYTQLDHVIVDKMMRKLSGAQFKVLILIARETIGWSHRERTDKLTLVRIIETTGLSRQGAVDAIHQLEDLEYIVKGGGAFGSKTEKAEPCWYSLNMDEQSSELTAPVSTEQSSELTADFAEQSSELTAQQSSELTALYKEVKKDLKEKKPLKETDQTPSQDPNQTSTPIPEQPLEPEDLNPEAAHFEPQSTSYDLQLREDAIVFVKKIYKRIRGIKLSSSYLKPLAGNIIRVEEDLSKEEFRTALCRYLDTNDDDWLKDNDWPIRNFLKKPTDYLASDFTTQSVAPRRPLGSNAHSADAPAGFQPQEKQETWLQYVDEWNTLIPEAVCGELPGFVIQLVRKAVENPEFREVWHEVLNKCGLIANHRPDVGVSFKWLFSVTQAGPQWQQIYMGKWDWATKPDRKAKADPFEQAMAMAEEAERNKV